MAGLRDHYLVTVTNTKIIFLFTMMPVHWEISLRINVLHLALKRNNMRVTTSTVAECLTSLIIYPLSCHLCVVEGSNPGAVFTKGITLKLS